MPRHSKSIKPLTLHRVFQSHAVVQRDCLLPVFGTGEPGTTVRCSLARRRALTTVRPDGTWKVELPAISAGGPFRLVAESGDSKAVASDVLVGDVFLCSGQSNMEWPLNMAQGGKAAMATCADDHLRLLRVPKKPSFAAQHEQEGEWRSCDPVTASVFSAVAYFAAAALRRANPEVPIGLIESDWGGTAAETWISPEGLQLFPALHANWRQVADLMSAFDKDREGHRRRLAVLRAEMTKTFDAWHKALCEVDGGMTAGLNQADADITDWKTHPVPGYWPNPLIGNHEGIVWFACDVEVPPDLAGKDLTLHLGEIDNEDTTWFNGEKIGAINLMDGPLHWQMQRSYKVPGHLVRKGANRITVRVIDYGGRGGFGGGAHGLCLTGNGQRIDLPETWRFRLGSPLTASRPTMDISMLEEYPVTSSTFSALYQGMIRPLAGMALAGAWWYQGESNVDRAEAYRALLAALILDWRHTFAPGPYGKLPFHIIQLTAFRQPPTHAGERSPWAELREAQTLALRLPCTAMAVILDCGDAQDIHPTNKRTVGERLALLTRRDLWKETLVADGPQMKSVEITGQVMTVTFTSSLKTRNGLAPGGFAISGENGVWVWAKAVVRKNTVQLQHPDVKQPAFVRYAWADNPAGANLVNRQGLPAWPFRTDAFSV